MVNKYTLGQNRRARPGDRRTSLPAARLPPHHQLRAYRRRKASPRDCRD